MSKKRPLKFASAKWNPLPKRKLVRQLDKVRLEAKIVLKIFRPEEIERICTERFKKSHDCLSLFEMKQLLKELRCLINSKKVAGLGEMIKQHRKSRLMNSKQTKAWISFSAFESNRRRH